MAENSAFQRRQLTGEIRHYDYGDWISPGSRLTGNSVLRCAAFRK